MLDKVSVYYIVNGSLFYTDQSNLRRTPSSLNASPSNVVFHLNRLYHFLQIAKLSYIDTIFFSSALHSPSSGRGIMYIYNQLVGFWTIILLPWKYIMTQSSFLDRGCIISMLAMIILMSCSVTKLK